MAFIDFYSIWIITYLTILISSHYISSYTVSIITSQQIGNLPFPSFSHLTDSLRLVMPPTLFLVLAYPWYRLAHLLCPYHYALGIYCGGIAGYISYDMTHYFLHHTTYSQHKHHTR